MSPIKYTWSLEVPFSFLDPYGHLNAKHYLDFVATSRLIYLERTVGTSISQLIKQNIGFYLKSATQEFITPIIGLCTIKASSYVSEVKGSSLIIPYKITAIDDSKVYSTGTLVYVVVNPHTGKPTDISSQVLDLFFERA